MTVKANMAHVMLRCAGVKPGDTICDPFCGSGTILMEAANWLNGDVKCIGKWESHLRCELFEFLVQLYKFFVC